MKVPPLQPSESTALVVVDVQVGFRNAFTAEVFSRIPQLLRFYRQCVFSLFENRVDSPVARFKGWSGMMQGDPLTRPDFDHDLVPPEDRLVVRKSAFSALTREALEWLRGRAVETLHIVGCDTDLCVTMTARDAMENGLCPCIFTDWVTSTAGEPVHRNALLGLKRLVGKHNLIGADIGEAPLPAGSTT